MPNVIEQAISTDDAEQAAKLIKQALGIESDDVVNYCFPISWPVDLSNARASSANGCRPRHAFWPEGLFSRSLSASSIALSKTGQPPRIYAIQVMALPL
jgi:hypothetical protein